MENLKNSAVCGTEGRKKTRNFPIFSGKLGLFQSILVGGASFFGGAFLNFLGTILSARLLGPDGRGQLAAMQVIPPLAVFLGSCGNQIALPILISRKTHEPVSLLSNAFTISALLFIPVLFVAALAQHYVLGHLKLENRLAGMLILATAPFISFLGLCWSYLQGLEKIQLFSVLRILPVLAYVIAIVIGSRIQGHQIFGIACLYLMALVCICLPVTFLSTLRLLKGKLFFDVSMRRELGTIGRPYLIAGGFVILNQSLPTLFLSKILSPSDLGMFTVGTAIGAVLSLTGSAVGAVFLPRASAQHTNPRACGPMLIGSTLFTFLMMIVFIIVMPFLVQVIFGHNFTKSVGLARILMVNSFLLSGTAVRGDTYRAIGHHQVPNLCEGSGLMFGMLMFFFFGLIKASLETMAFAWVAGNLLSYMCYTYFDDKLIFRGFSGFKSDFYSVIGKLIKKDQSIFSH